MKKILNWFYSILGVETDDDEEEINVPLKKNDDFVEVDKQQTKVQKKKEFTQPQSNDLTVIVLSPSSFEEAKKAVDFLKSQKPVVANFEEVDRSISGRFIDFVSGAIYAMDGRAEKISQYVVFFAPPNVFISAEQKNEYANDPIFTKKPFEE
jgi:cell division inhibitor SepF